MNPSTTATTTTTIRPRPYRVVTLVLDERGGPGAMRAASKRDDRKIREIVRRRSPVSWGDLLRGAIDRRYAIRVTLPGFQSTPLGEGRHVRIDEPCSGIKDVSGNRRLTLAVAEDSDRGWLEVVPLGESDRAVLASILGGREVEGGILPRPSVLVPAALARGVEVVVRCDVRLPR